MNRRVRHVEAIADAIDGSDAVVLRRCLLNFLSQVFDVAVDHAVTGVVQTFVGDIQHVRSGKYPTGVRQQKLKEAVFHGRQVQLLRAPMDAQACFVNAPGFGGLK